MSRGRKQRYWNVFRLRYFTLVNSEVWSTFVHEKTAPESDGLDVREESLSETSCPRTTRTLGSVSSLCWKFSDRRGKVLTKTKSFLLLEDTADHDRNILLSRRRNRTWKDKVSQNGEVDKDDEEVHHRPCNGWEMGCVEGPCLLLLNPRQGDRRTLDESRTDKPDRVPGGWRIWDSVGLVSSIRYLTELRWGSDLGLNLSEGIFLGISQPSSDPQVLEIRPQE